MFPIFPGIWSPNRWCFFDRFLRCGLVRGNMSLGATSCHLWFSLSAPCLPFKTDALGSHCSACRHASCCDGEGLSSLWSCEPKINSFFSKLAMVFYPSNWKVSKTEPNNIFTDLCPPYLVRQKIMPNFVFIFSKYICKKNIELKLE